jgi:tape measure domain-containing protein
VATVDSTVKLLEAAGKSAEEATKQIEKMTKATEKLTKAMTKASKINVLSSKALNSQQRMIKNFEKIIKTIQKVSAEQKKLNQLVSTGQTLLRGQAAPLNRLVSLSSSIRSNLRDASRSASFLQRVNNQVQRLTRAINQMTRPLNQIMGVLRRLIRSFGDLNRATRTFLNSLQRVITAVRQIRDVLSRIRDLTMRASSHMRQFSRQAMSGRAALNRLAPPMRHLVTLSNTLRSNMQQVNRYTQSVQRASGQQGQFLNQNAKANRWVDFGQKVFNSLSSMMKRGLSNLFSAQNFKSAMAFSDNYMNSLTRVSAINDGSQSDKELQSKILAAADRSRGRYLDMAEHITKLGLSAPQAFSGNDEIIAFTELSQKAFRLGGAGAMEQQAGMDMLVQAMSMGGLQGNDFQMIMDKAPMLADAIASFTGKSKEELIALSAEGLITSDILKGALFYAADEINRKFEGLPNTFGDLWNDISNSAVEAFGPVIERVSQLLNSEKGQRLVSEIGQAFQVAATFVGQLIEGIAMVASFIINNWSVFEPILWGVVAAVGAWTIAQWVLNAALSANPIGLIVMAVAAMIGIITALVMWIAHLWRTNDAFAENMLRAWYGILNFFDRAVAFFWQVAEWLVQPFVQWAIQIGNLVENAINGIIGGINHVLGYINNIFGTSYQLSVNFDFQDIAQDLQDFQDRVTQNKIDAIDRAARNEAEREQKIKDFFADRAAKRALEDAERQAKEEQETDYSKWQKEPSEWPTNQPNINKVNEVGRINDTVDISSEDLKMMRELAEMNAIQNFVSLTPTVNVQTGDIRNGYDVDTIISRIEQSLTEQIASSAQGVYGLG